jgi:hypothetical protein
MTIGDVSALTGDVALRPATSSTTATAPEIAAARPRGSVAGNVIRA